MKEKKEKPLKEKPKPIKWRGVYNFKHQIHILYCYSTTERGAWRNMCYQLAKKHGVEVWHTMNMFNGEKSNFLIEKV